MHPRHRIPEETRNKIRSIYRDKYPGSGTTSFRKKLSCDHDIHYSVSAINKILQESGDVKPKHRLYGV